jgi:hypothetical protein
MICYTQVGKCGEAMVRVRQSTPVSYHVAVRFSTVLAADFAQTFYF